MRYEDVVWCFAVAILLLVLGNQIRHKEEAERSKDAYASMLGRCLGGGTLWDKLNEVAYFCSVTPVKGL